MVGSEPPTRDCRGYTTSSYSSPPAHTSRTNMDERRFELRWRHHQSTVVTSVASLYRDAALVDVTLACEDQRTYQAHKLVLSACSQYFQVSRLSYRTWNDSKLQCNKHYLVYPNWGFLRVRGLTSFINWCSLPVLNTSRWVACLTGMGTLQKF